MAVCFFLRLVCRLGLKGRWLKGQWLLNRRSEGFGVQERVMRDLHVQTASSPKPTSFYFCLPLAISPTISVCCYSYNQFP